MAGCAEGNDCRDRKKKRNVERKNEICKCSKKEGAMKRNDMERWNKEGQRLGDERQYDNS